MRALFVLLLSLPAFAQEQPKPTIEQFQTAYAVSVKQTEAAQRQANQCGIENALLGAQIEKLQARVKELEAPKETKK